jgi:hypothetical protein
MDVKWILILILILINKNTFHPIQVRIFMMKIFTKIYSYPSNTIENLKTVGDLNGKNFELLSLNWNIQ